MSKQNGRTGHGRRGEERGGREGRGDAPPNANSGIRTCYPLGHCDVD